MAIKTKEQLYEAIRSCSNRASLDTLFTNFTKEQRIGLLLDIMGNPAISYSCGYPSVDERYEVIVGAYLSGIWRRDYLSFKSGGKFNDF